MSLVDSQMYFWQILLFI